MKKKPCKHILSLPIFINKCQLFLYKYRETLRNHETFCRFIEKRSIKKRRFLSEKNPLKYKKQTNFFIESKQKIRK